MILKSKVAVLAFIVAFLFNSLRPAFAQTVDKTVEVKIMLDKPVGDMYPMWAWFGYDEPNYTYMKDGKKLLTELAALSPTPVYVRAHSLLVSGDGVAVNGAVRMLIRKMPRATPYITGLLSTVFLTPISSAV